MFRTGLFTMTAIAATLALACSAPPNDDPTGTSSAAATSRGSVIAGNACLANPVYRKDKCAAGLVCNQAPGASRGVCRAISAENGPCDPAFGDRNCQTGLVCAALPDGRGFCKGAGTGSCVVSQGGTGCAAGRTCVPSQPGSDLGSCVVSDGSEGSACNAALVENSCDDGLDCAVSSLGSFCRRPGALGTLCDDWQECDVHLTCASTTSGETRCEPLDSGRCVREADCAAGSYCNRGRCDAYVQRGGRCERFSLDRQCAPGLSCTHYAGSGSYSCE